MTDGQSKNRSAIPPNERIFKKFSVSLTGRLLDYVIESLLLFLA